jgi:hypothetical protein
MGMDTALGQSSATLVKMWSIDDTVGVLFVNTLVAYLAGMKINHRENRPPFAI